MKRQSIANRLMRNYRPEQGRKRKRRMHRLWQQPRHLFNQRLGRVAVFTIRLRLQWPRAPCVLRAVNLDDKSFAGFWEEFSAAARGEDNYGRGLWPPNLPC